MKKLVLVFTLVFSQALALNTPKGSKYDSRVAFAIYNAEDVFKIFAKNGFVSVIEFGKDENIVNTATGFSEGWDLVDKGNMLFIKPKSYRTSLVNGGQGEGGEFILDPSYDWNTNLIVITDKNTYIFDLILVKNSKPTYKVSFSYPAKDKQKNALEEKIRAIKEENDFVETHLNRNPVPRNWDFYMKINDESNDIAPNYAYDDGVFTYLGFDNTKTFPSVFAYQNGSETILNTHIRKEGDFDVLVVQKIAKNIILRSGEKVVGIFNNGYAKNPLNQTRETSHDKVERQINK